MLELSVIWVSCLIHCLFSYGQMCHLTSKHWALSFPYSVSIAIVGLLESLMTANVIDELTDTESDKKRECKGQGIANIGFWSYRWYGGVAR